FHPRCPMAADRCRTERPALRPLGGAEVACHFAE
ncbi:MAG: dipeptide ABC transporter ATP binding subunit DppF, partial [Rhizobiaceae bacterium]